MKTILLSALSIITISAQSQNTGIGPSMPAMKLHISSAADTTLLLVDNNTALASGTNVGMYFKNGSWYTGALKTTGQGTNVARMGLYTFAAGTTEGLKERISILDNGNVGIQTTNPTTTLDVNGTMKITGGNPGAGKVLTSDATGTASWQLPAGAGCMQNSKNLTTLAYNYFTIPAGVTRLFVEMWGSGGAGGSTASYPAIVGGGGGAGAYASFFMDVTPGGNLITRVNAPGIGGNSNYTVVRYNADSVVCYNGENGNGAPGRGGSVAIGYNGFTLNTAVFVVEGEGGQANSFENYTYAGANYTEYIGGKGGDSYKQFGQLGQVTRVNSGGVETTKAEISTFTGVGVGGGGITRAAGATIGNNQGGYGSVVVYW